MMRLRALALLALSQAACAGQAPSDEDLQKACQVPAVEVRAALNLAEAKQANEPVKVGRCHIEKGDDGRVRLGFIGEPPTEGK
jgi:hypothetical protein